MDTLTAATRPKADSGEFIYAFLDAYDFPKATLTQIRNGGQRNVASRKDEGHVALKKWLYYMPVRQGESIHEALQVLADEDEPARHKCRFLVVTDFREMTALDTKTDERLEVGFGELATQYLFFAPMAGLERTKHFEEASADLKAAAKMGRLFDRLKEVNEFSTPEQLHALNVFLTRLLFCYFAEDTGIFPKNAFTKVITEASGENGEDLPDLLTQLFRVMNQPEDERPADLAAHVAQFPYVNGGLFRDDLPVPEIRGTGRRMMIECGRLAWEAVNPDIFGSMFQAVVDEESRDSMGQHYTSVPNIMKVIRPLFLDKLYAELHKDRGNRKKLEALLERLSHIKVFDPAMGSGNFLIIAYKELRRLEMSVFRAMQDVGEQKQNELFMSGIRLSQFYGIEIDDFAYEVAQLSLWLAEHQMNMLFAKEFGHAEPLLPLKDAAQLVAGNSLQLNWLDVCWNGEGQEVYICGNPPFHGTAGRNVEQARDMKRVFGKKALGYLDYVACWFQKGTDYLQPGGEAAFVSTNSLCQGQQVATLWPGILNSGIEISFAYQTFPWSNSAQSNAGVHVVIIGLSTHPTQKRLYQRVSGEWRMKIVKNISPYLVEGGNTIVSSRNRSLVPALPMVRGNQPTDGGNLILSESEKDQLLDREQRLVPWIKPLIGAQEFLKGDCRWCLWLVGAPEEVLNIPEVRSRLDAVRALRIKAGHAAALQGAKRPHQFLQVAQPEEGSYILVPAFTSERRPYVPLGFMESDVISNNKNYIIPDGGLYEFSVLSSIMHLDWMRLVCGRLESRYGYSSRIVYNTFPWPEVSERDRQEIEKLGRAIILARAAHPDKTMTQLYDPDKMPDNLLETHQALDRAVEKLYRDRPFRDTAERQEYLLARYEALIEAEKASKPSRTKKSRNAVTKEG
ncbi:DNA methyltransferase [Chromohalobacter canadensis]|uniref:site-specific DNA-methyltransferase (adenine-specific) n=1 Tax=Chromohalobacter canadensis TaxID=141389 RepID=A0ABZ0YF48_9GAMM|nr:DNA methyltransferase [Chromohalobacter canadensis]MCK0767344.1 N-6 DNA methylase [Chromohalobacter canadensis]WQH10052.1 DNA methyltransferase [Chromohalobacter canadensis]